MPFKCVVIKEEPFDVSVNGVNNFNHTKTEFIDVGHYTENTNFAGVPHDSIFISQHIKHEGIGNDTVARSVRIPESSIPISRLVNYEEIVRQDLRDEKKNHRFFVLPQDSISVVKPISYKTVPKEANSLNEDDMELNVEEANPVSLADVKSFCCNHCERKFKRKFHLKLHLRTHTGEKPYKCDECSAKFAYRAVLRNHKFVHSGEKPFECEICGAGFTKKFNLKSHVSRIHSKGVKLEPVEKKFNCDICKSKFVRLSALKVHERKHSSNRPFKCTICEKKFKYKHVLKKHLKSFTHALNNSFKGECDIS